MAAMPVLRGLVTAMADWARDGKVPPVAGKAYPVLVPQVDQDGNPTGGVQMPRVAVALGTYWGWNVRAEGFAGGALCGLTGSAIPFAQSSTDGDDRPGIVDRYADEDAYVASVREVAEALATDGYMPAEDVDLVATRAAEDFQAASQ